MTGPLELATEVLEKRTEQRYLPALLGYSNSGTSDTPTHVSARASTTEDGRTKAFGKRRTRLDDLDP